MARVLEQRILTAKKIHDCDASYHVISECISNIMDELTFKEKRACVRMKNAKMKILPGTKYIRQANIIDGDFYVWKADLEMHQICVRLDLYEED